MSSLAEVSKELKEQNDILENVDKGVGNVSRSLNSFVSTFVRDKNRDRLQALEEDREKQKQASSQTRAETKSRSDVKSSGGLGGLGGLLSGALGGLGGLLGVGTGALTAAGLAGLLKEGFGKVLKKGLVFAILESIAGPIADYVQGETGSKEIGDMVFRSLNAAGIGYVLGGKKFGLLAGVLGALYTDEMSKQLGILADNIERETKEALEGVDFGIDIPTDWIQNLRPEVLLKNTQDTIENALKGLNATIDNDPRTEATKEQLSDLMYAVAGLIVGGVAFNIFGLRTLAGSALNNLVWKPTKYTGKMFSGGMSSLFSEMKSGVGRPNVVSTTGKPPLFSLAAANDANFKPSAQLFNFENERAKRAVGGSLYAGERIPGGQSTGSNFKLPKMPNIPRVGPIGAAAVLGAGIYDAATETDPNLYGLGDLYRDITGFFTSDGKKDTTAVSSQKAAMLAEEATIYVQRGITPIIVQDQSSTQTSISNNQTAIIPQGPTVNMWDQTLTSFNQKYGTNRR